MDHFLYQLKLKILLEWCFNFNTMDSLKETKEYRILKSFIVQWRQYFLINFYLSFKYRYNQSSSPQPSHSHLQWRWMVYCILVCRCYICMNVCGTLPMPVSLTSPWCQLMSVSVSVNVKDAVVIHPHHGGMTLFVTVVTDSASLRGACASAVSERLSLCFNHTHSITHTDTHRHTQTHCWNWQQRRAYPIVGGIRLGSRKKLIRLMLASPAPVRAFVCVIRKNTGLNLKRCHGNDAHKTRLYDVDMFLSNRGRCSASYLIEQSSGK